MCIFKGYIILEHQQENLSVCESLPLLVLLCSLCLLIKTAGIDHLIYVTEKSFFRVTVFFCTSFDIQHLAM